MQVPILAYHSVNFGPDSYAGNDLAAFAHDLRLIDDMGLRIVPLQRVIDRLLGRHDDDLHGCVALTCDDGCELDFRDRVHPELGLLRSFMHSLAAFRAERGAQAQSGLHLTSFVIADPVARKRMELECLGGLEWLGEDWWRQAETSGLMAVENHSWDHNHPCLPSPGPNGIVRGDFHSLADDAQVRFEIADAQHYIAVRIGRAPRLFCYPFSHVAPFVRDWLAEHGPALGLDAAFGDGAAPIGSGSDRWNLPRYICGWHWRSPQELKKILAG